MHQTPRQIETELKVRAIRAVASLKDAGISNYVPLIIKRHPKAAKQAKINEIREVANSRKANEEITLWLEELVSAHVINTPQAS